MTCGKGSKGAILNVKASKLPLMLSQEKFEHSYFSSHSKVLSPNLFILKFIINAIRVWLTDHWGDLHAWPLLSQMAMVEEDEYSFTQTSNPPYPTWLSLEWASDLSWNIKFLPLNFCIRGTRGNLTTGCKAQRWATGSGPAAAATQRVDQGKWLLMGTGLLFRVHENALELGGGHVDTTLQIY